MTSPSSAPPVPGPVKGLAAVSLFNDVASEMVYPVLPAFLTGTLGAGALALGVLDGAADLTAAVLRWWSGRLADRPGWRSPLVLVGYGLAVVARPAIAVTTAAWQVVSCRVIDRVGKGIRSPARDALIADLAPPAIHGRAFGLHRAADHLGAVLGSLAAYLLLARGVATRHVIAASLFPGLAAVLVLSVVVRRAQLPSAVVEPAASGGAKPARGPLDLRLVALAALAAFRLPETLLLLRLQDLGVAVALIPLVWSGLHVVRSASSYPAGALADRVGVGGVLVLGVVFYAAGLAGLSQPVGPGGGIAIVLAQGLASGLLEPAERVAVAAVGGAKRGHAFGTYQGLVGIGSLGTALLLGWLYQARGGALALALAAGLTLLGLGIWAAAGGGRPRPGPDGASLAGPGGHR